ncbi:MAG: putative bifunctional diguanylate cyclase/phosphodiesterase, partial [Gammaproteobacteria bacterium]
MSDREKPLVLIVDDDPIARTLSEQTLRAANFDTVSVPDGPGTLARFTEIAPDVVLLDVEMPGMDGFTVCRRLREQPAGRRLPIIMVTSHDDSASINRAYEAGAQDFINKPIPWAVLPHRIRYALKAQQAFDELERSEKRNRMLLKAIPDQIHIVNARGELIEYLGDKDIPLSAGDSLDSFLPPDAALEARDYIHRALESGELQTYEHDLGEERGQFETRLVAQNDDTVLAIVRDVTDRKRAEAQVHHLAYHDNLTGLPNRQHFSNKLRRAIRNARDQGRMLATLYIDLDRFKRINDTLGHRVGDALLKAVAKRLDHCIRDADSVTRVNSPQKSEVRLARLGGDEFVVLIDEIDNVEQVDAVADRIRSALLAPFKYEGHQFVVTPSIGIALYPRDGDKFDDLLMNADMAMYRAKAAGRNSHRYYSDTMNLRSMERLDLEHEIQDAIRRGAFRIHYQPKFDVRTSRIVGVEALLRWNHPERGWVSPVQFVPIAEETGLIVELGEWVVHQACRQIRGWEKKGINDVSIAINVSSQQFCRGDLLESVLRTVRDTGIRPQSLELEITESLLMRDVEETRAALQAFKKAGLRISVDDFGTGYSSLSY